MRESVDMQRRIHGTLNPRLTRKAFGTKSFLVALMQEEGFLLEKGELLNKGEWNQRQVWWAVNADQRIELHLNWESATHDFLRGIGMNHRAIEDIRHNS